MKQSTSKIFTALAVIAAGLCYAFTYSVSGDPELKNHTIQNKEKIHFSGLQRKESSSFSGSYKRGAYDHSAYDLSINKEGIVTLKELNACEGAHQNALDLILCSGTVTQKDDTITIKLKTSYQNLYIIRLDNKVTKADKINPNSTIRLVSKTLKHEHCETLINNYSSFSSIYALPHGIDPKVKSNAKHADNEVGVFSYLNIGGKMYPEGDYIILGGNGFVTDF